ncbi:MAG: PKD domain-containing protein [Bacteroidota bacterium]
MHPKNNLLITLLLLAAMVQAQNTYHRLLEYSSCNNWIRVDNPPAEVQNQSFATLIWQTGGAEIFTADNAQFGQLDELNGLGLYEINETIFASGDTLFLDKSLVNDYALSGLTQVVLLPLQDTYMAPTLSAPDFDGSLGGAIFLMARNKLEITGEISAAGRGYSGGGDLISNSNCNAFTAANDYFYPLGNWRGAPKGSGGAPLPDGRELGRGPLLNGGGGGNDHNTGGGGGANVTRGGTGATNETPGLFTCNGNFAGIGGYGLPNDPNRLFMGGGGGSGHSNNNADNAGGPGGGLIILLADTIDFGPNASLLAQGLAAETIGGDGGGGGGAGGTIALSANVLVGNPLAVDLSGGGGGQVDNENFDRCMGPGGGGSGGRFVQLSFGALSADLSGGTGGLDFDSEACDDGENPGENGQDGVYETGTTVEGDSYLDTELASAQLMGTDGAVCAGTSTTLSVNYDGCLPIVWLVCTSAGGVPPSIEANFQILSNDDLEVSDLSQDTLKMLAGLQYLDSVYVLPDTVTLLNSTAPTASFTFVLINSLLTLDPGPNPPDTEYQWSYGDGNGSTDSVPEPYMYGEFGPFTIELIVSNACGTDTLQQSVFISPPPATATILGNTFDGCAPFELILSDNSQGIYDSLYWSLPGGNPNESFDTDFSVIYEDPGEYTVGLELYRSGIQNGSTQQTIRVFESPIVDFETSLNELELTTTNLSQFGETYLWTFGDGNESPDFEPIHFYSASGDYEVGLVVANPGCSDSTSQMVSVLSSTIELSDTDYKLYPNPAQTFVWLEGGGISAMRLYSLAGQEVRSWQSDALADTIRRLDLSGLPAGGYVLVIESERFGAVRQRIVKTR